MAEGTYSYNKGNHQQQHQPKSKVPDVVKELDGDLFSCPGDFSLAHCVAEDFRMGSGISVKFKEQFKRAGELLDQNVRVGGCAHLHDNESDRYIFYLVTKELSIGKPKIESLQESLRALKAKCLKFEVKKLAMPRIGCGLDRLDWNRVKASINETFHDTDIEVRVYDFNVERVSEAGGNGNDGKPIIKYTNEKRLVNIHQETALLFLGTEDGHMDPTAVSLNDKHHFDLKYRKAEKTVGKVVVFEFPKYNWVFGLIVAKSAKDKVKYTSIEQCCGHLSQLLRKAGFRYAGIEYPQGWNDDKLFLEKILTVFHASLWKSVELWVCFPSAELDVLKPIKDKMPPRGRVTKTGGGREDSWINHHPIPSHPHHPPPQGQPPRTQQEAHSAEAVYDNYSFHPATLPSPELINSTPQSQSFSTYPQPIYPQQQFMDLSCYQQQPPIVTTPPAMVPPPPLESNLTRKFHFNSKDNMIHCVNCGHKNLLAEIEFIKKEERIDSVEKENCILRKEKETLMVEKKALTTMPTNNTLTTTNNALRLKLEALQSEELQKVDIDLKSLWASIEEVANCPICLELLKPPVTLCVNGHGTCCECRGTLTKCPTCRQPYCNNEPRVLNEILQKIPKVCKYYDEGCREPAKDDHELYCMFRKVKCIFHDKDSLGYCNWEGPAHKFEFGHVYDTEHLESCSHDIVGPNTLKFRKFKDPYPEKSIYDPGSPGHKLFIFTHVKINGNFCLYIEMFPLEKPKVTTYFTLIFLNSAGKVVYQYRLKATTKTTLERDVIVDDNIYCMRVALEELEKLIDEAGDLYVNCEITSEPLQ